jgi:nitroreductase
LQGTVSRLKVPTREAILAKWGDDDFALAFARIENHYFTGRDGVPGFFPRDGWLLEEANLAKIRHLPTVIVQGRYDVVCPATSAYELHQKLPDSTLHLTTTGHSSFEPEIIERLVDATDAFAAVDATPRSGSRSWRGWRGLRARLSGRRQPAPAAPAPKETAAEAAHRLLTSRRTINEFEPVLPADWEASLLKAVEAATYAPNHRRTEPWRFHLLGPKAIGRVCELNAELVAAKKGADAGAKKRERWLQIPGWLVVTCKHSDAGKVVGMMDDPTGVAREDYAATCCAVQNLMLSLHAQGLGTKWTTGPVNFDGRFAAAAGLPSDEYMVGTIWFGRAAKGAQPPRKRLSAADALSRCDD